METQGSQWIEDIPIAEMKLHIDNFKVIYKEFLALSELTTMILQKQGILLKSLTQTARHNSTGLVSTRFNEFDETQEMEMDEEAVYSSCNNRDILTMQPHDDAGDFPE